MAQAPSLESVNETVATISSQRASSRERNVSFVLVGLLVAATVLAVPFHQRAFATAPSFIPAFAAMTGTTELLAAALLFGLYRVDGTRAVLAAAIAYLLDALLIVPYAVTFPGVIDAHGFIGNEQSAVTLWLVWHLAFPIAILFGALDRPTRGTTDRRMRDIGRAIAATVLAAALAAYVAIVQKQALPILVHDGHFTATFQSLSSVVSLVTGIAIFALLRRVRPLSAMQLWLIVALASSFLDTALNGISPARYSFAWYIGKAETLITATVVLVAFLSSWSTMYTRSIALTHRLTRSLAEGRSLQDTLDRERHVSMALQAAALPRSLPAFDGVVLNAAYHPGSAEATIGGDWYDAFALEDGRIGVTIGDVMGSGVAAAVTMSKLRQAMQAAGMVTADPVVMLNVAERTLRLHNPDSYATALALVYDPRVQRATFATAGHLSPLLREADGTVSEFLAAGTMLGFTDEFPRSAYTLDAPPGSILVLYTDGIIEFTRDVLEGQQRLFRALADARTTSTPEPANAIVANVLNGGKATDDIAVLTLSFVGARAERDPVMLRSSG